MVFLNFCTFYKLLEENTKEIQRKYFTQWVCIRNLKIAQSFIASGYFDKVCLETLRKSPINIFHHKFALHKNACTMNFFFDKLK